MTSIPMRSLTSSQWERYLDLVERLDGLPADHRLAALQGEDTEYGKDEVLALARLRFSLAPDPDRSRGGERIRNFVLKEQIGRGGMGVVYRAAQVFSDGIERDVAVKLINPQLLALDPDAALSRFHREIATLVQLEHKAIARVYDGGLERDGASREKTLFLAMELVRGRSLADYVRDSKPAVTEIVRLLLKVCDAVAYAHHEGIIHRDLKPANILVDPNAEPHIIDFGLALTRGATLAGARPELVCGTPAYMSPEQLSPGAEPLTPGCDVYALGVILYELLAGRHPHRSENGQAPAASATKDVESLAETLVRFCPTCSLELARVVAKAMAARPEERYRSVASFSKALGRCLKAAESDRQRLLRYRRFLLCKVQAFWINGVLKDSLHGAVPMEFGLALCPDAIAQPWDSIVPAPDRESRRLHPGTPIGSVFRQLGEAMLILGAPGAGKTTLLLQLASELLDAARHDDSVRLPVIFHLSTWAQARLPLTEWLLDELEKRYDLPPAAGRMCLASEQILLLLDGLDEVAPAHRAECVAAINVFRVSHHSMSIAVCSRVAGYDELPVRLRLGGAVIIEALTRLQIEDYLERAGAPLVGLRSALRHDDRLRDLLATPLLLGIAALVYQARPPAQNAETLAQWRAHLFAAYVSTMFQRRGKAAPYTEEQSRRWLAWLAATMQRQHQSVMYLEWMQPDWLTRPLERWAVTVGSVAMCGLLVGVVVGLCASLATHIAFSLPISLALGLTGGLVFGILGHGDRIRPITRLGWSWPTLCEGLVGKLTLAGGAGLLLIAGISLVFDPWVGVAVGLGTTTAFFYFGGIDLDLPATRSGDPTTRGDGMRQSLRNALRGGLAGSMLAAVAAGLLDGLDGALFGAAVFGVIMTLLLGGHTCLQHYILRVLLWRSGSAPWRYGRFLDYAVDRALLHRVGGGYAFVHRELMEHFAGTRSMSSQANDRRIETNLAPRTS